MRPQVRRGSLSFVVFLAAVIFVCPGGRSADQKPQSAPNTAVKVSGEVSHPLTLTAADLAALPHQNVSADEKTSRQRYQAVAVVDLLRRAGAPLGSALRGSNMRLYVVVKGRDGYAAVFALPEFDPGFTDRVIVLAYLREGRALGPVEGPFRIIVPGEKRRARWVRQVTDIEVRSAQ
ncbi:MAG TPA: molybdopterin-dependent oxidoreductase [Candidatus Binataceae bacterium]|nr:molybdopterin-dependent oxidoreductase [Candidatus Binataceae bacterium]